MVRGERAPKKRSFEVKVFRKVPQNAFFGMFFFQNFACDAENLAKTVSFECFGRGRQSSQRLLQQQKNDFGKSSEN